MCEDITTTEETEDTSAKWNSAAIEIMEDWNELICINEYMYENSSSRSGWLVIKVALKRLLCSLDHEEQTEYVLRSELLYSGT